MDFSTLCRCCLKVLCQEDIKCSSPLTMAKYTFCIQLQMCDEINLPKTFCRICSDTIQSTFTFIKKAQACNQKLQNQLSRNKRVKIEYGSQNGNTLINSSLKDLLENSSSKLTEISTQNHNSNESHELILLKERHTQCNIVKSQVIKRKQKIETITDIRTTKFDTSDSGDEENSQNIDQVVQDSLEDTELSSNNTVIATWFLDLKPVENINNTQIKEESRLTDLKTDDDIEESITKCEISKSIERVDAESPEMVIRRQRTGNPEFTCPICGKICKQYPSFERHMSTHNSGDETTTMTQSDVIALVRAKPYACDQCDKRFRFRVLLGRHQFSMHSDEKPFGCHHCHKKFKRKEHLRIHLRTHTSKGARERPFECDQCGKRFAEKRGLTTHIFFHSGKRPYSCQHCQKSFQTRQILRKHLGMHEAGFPLMCDVCGKGFRDKYKLAEHMPRHTGERSFPCSACSYRAAYRSVIRRHEKIVHKLTGHNNTTNTKPIPQ